MSDPINGGRPPSQPPFNGSSNPQESDSLSQRIGNIAKQSFSFLSELLSKTTKAGADYLKLKQSLRLSHDNFIDLLQKLGYKGNENGICFGFALMGLQAIILRETDSFNLRLKKLETLINHYQNNPAELKKAIEKDSNFLPFFEGIELYYQAASYPHLFEDSIEDQLSSIPHVSKLLLPGETQEGLEELADYENAYNRESLASHLSDLKNQMEGETPLGIVLISPNHAVSLGYDKDKKIWNFIDANHVFIQEAGNEIDMAHLIFEGFNYSQAGLINISVFAGQKKSQISVLKTLLEQLSQTPPFFQQIEFLVQNKMLFESQDFSYHLFHALKNDSQAFELLIKNKADPNTRSYDGKESLLDRAIYYKNLKIIELLLNYGANPNIPDSNGLLALHQACQSFKETIPVLLKHHADPNITFSNGYTPLILALQYDDLSYAKLLLKYGADPNIPGPDGLPPLLFACDRKDVSLVKEFIKHGADPNFRLPDGETPLSISRKIGDIQMVRALTGW